MADVSTMIRPITNGKIDVIDDSGNLISVDNAKTLVGYVISQAQEVEAIPSITLLGKKVIENFDSFLIPIIEHIETFDYGYSVVVESSGTDLTEEYLQIMRRKRITPIIKINWALENNTLSEEFTNSVINIVNYFPSVSSEFKITPQNVSNLANIVATMKNLGIYTYKVSPDYFVEWNDNDYNVLESQIQLIKNSAIQIFEEDDLPALFEDFLFMFRKIVAIIGEKQMEAEYRSIPVALPCNRCGMGINGQVLIANNGDFHSCLRCKNNDFIVGNITDGVSSEIVQSLLDNVNSSPAIGIDCNNCSLDRICIGGCSVANFVVNGNVNYVTDVYCHWMQMLHKATSDIIEYFDATQTNDLFKDYFYGMVNRGGYYGC